MVDIQRVIVDSYGSYLDKNILRLPLRSDENYPYHFVVYDLSLAFGGFKPALLWPAKKGRSIIIVDANYRMHLSNNPLIVENDKKISLVGIVRRNPRNFFTKNKASYERGRVHGHELRKLNKYVEGFCDEVKVGLFSRNSNRNGWDGPEESVATLAVIVGYLG